MPDRFELPTPLASESAMAFPMKLTLTRPHFVDPQAQSVGLLSLSLFSYLAATYLAVEVGDRELQDNFRRRALFSGAASVCLAILTVLAAFFAQCALDSMDSRP